MKATMFCSDEWHKSECIRHRDNSWPLPTDAGGSELAPKTRLRRVSTTHPKPHQRWQSSFTARSPAKDFDPIVVKEAASFKSRRRHLVSPMSAIQQRFLWIGLLQLACVPQDGRMATQPSLTMAVYEPDVWCIVPCNDKLPMTRDSSQ